MDKRFNFYGHSLAKKVWYIDGVSFQSDKGTNNGKQKAIAYTREHMLDDKDIKKFDSEMEFKRYLFLERKAKLGEIKELKDHVNFRLLPKFLNSNSVEHDELLYEADFYYYDNKAKKYVVEDVKGNLEDVFRVKWKLFDYLFRNKNLAIVCVRMRKRKDLTCYDEDSWYCFTENAKSTKRIDKMRAELAELKAKEKEREKQMKIEAKEKLKLEVLKKKLKLTKKEQLKLVELTKKYER